MSAQEQLPRSPFQRESEKDLPCSRCCLHSPKPLLLLLRAFAASLRQAERHFITRLQALSQPPYLLSHRARKLGLDMSNPRIRADFHRWADRRRGEDLRRKARELGVDLGHPEVRRVLAEMGREREAGRDPGSVLGRLRRRGAWRRAVGRAFDPGKALNAQNVLYALLLARLVFTLGKARRCADVRPTTTAYSS